MHPFSVTRLPFTLTESSVVAIIPARYDSTRFPGKILADLAVTDDAAFKSIVDQARSALEKKSKKAA